MALSIIGESLSTARLLRLHDPSLCARIATALFKHSWTVGLSHLLPHVPSASQSSFRWGPVKFSHSVGTAHHCLVERVGILSSRQMISQKKDKITITCIQKMLYMREIGTCNPKSPNSFITQSHPPFICRPAAVLYFSYLVIKTLQ